MDITFNDDGSAVLTPTSEEAGALGEEFGSLLEWFGTALSALAHLRNGSTEDFDRKTWAHMLVTSERHLGNRLDGIGDALIRAHAAAGGQPDPPTSAPSGWERWAVSGEPPGAASWS